VSHRKLYPVQQKTQGEGFYQNSVYWTL
jgi:hypothetical protein